MPTRVKKEKDDFALMGKNKVGNESFSIVKSVLKEFHHVDSKVIQPCLPSMRDIQQSDLKVTMEPLKSNFDSKPSIKEGNILIQKKANKDCVLNVVSENEKKFELPSYKHVVFEEIFDVGDVQNFFDIINEEIDEMGCKQLVMVKACKNELEVCKTLEFMKFYMISKIKE